MCSGDNMHSNTHFSLDSYQALRANPSEIYYSVFFTIAPLVEGLGIAKFSDEY